MNNTNSNASDNHSNTTKMQTRSKKNASNNLAQKGKKNSTFDTKKSKKEWENSNSNDELSSQGELTDSEQQYNQSHDLIGEDQSNTSIKEEHETTDDEGEPQYHREPETKMPRSHYRAVNDMSRNRRTCTRLINKLKD